MFRNLFAGAAAVLALLSSACTPRTDRLVQSISDIVSECPGEIGVAVIIDGKDTVVVGNERMYPMMSVFKLHQALAACADFDKKGLSLDTLLTIERSELDAHTWSPMLKEHPEPVFELSVGELLRYELIQSDNNASNLLFGRIVSVERTDAYIATLIPRGCFRIACTEAEMSSDHSKLYENYTSPLGAAVLIERLFTEDIISSCKQDFIKQALGECATGQDRISAALAGKEGVRIAHKTGSGYTMNGVLSAHNDLAFITLPDGRHYTLAVFVKDIRGDESLASGFIAKISAAVYEFATQVSGRCRK